MDLKISDETFEKAEQKRISELFDHTIGLVYDMEKPTTVEISVTSRQAKYVKKSPLHLTQAIVSENEVVFHYILVPSRELQRLLLGFGSQVKVIQPVWFALQMKKQIAEMAGRYDS
ncbi:MAG: WYL domain-containing protein [Dysgonamonadaceae bacterium]|nr:WYL domain-containing protein [Dysgonamonadaceae bacterium]